MNYNSGESETEEEVNPTISVKDFLTLQRYIKKRNPDVQVVDTRYSIVGARYSSINQ